MNNKRTAALVLTPILAAAVATWVAYPSWKLAKSNYRLENDLSQERAVIIPSDCKGVDEEGRRYQKISGRLQSLEGSRPLEGPGIEYIAKFVQSPGKGGEIGVMLWAADSTKMGKLRSGKEYSICASNIGFYPDSNLPLYQGALTTMESD